ncbi:MAG: hypothetical protein ACRD22_11270 [Terriglobia bacterium]
MLSLTYKYNLLGRLTERKSPTAGLRQEFYYDNLGRIEQATLYHNDAQSQNRTYSYDAIGKS